MRQSSVWVTLFDYVQDDLYDGDFTENDMEQPRIQMQFKLTSEQKLPLKKKGVSMTKTSYISKGTKHAT